MLAPPCDGASPAPLYRPSLIAVALVSVAAALSCLALSAQASAAQVLHFKEAFGSAAQPTFANATGMAVDQSTGDLLVMDVGDPSAEPPVAPSISRFKPDGTPDDFPALGTNVISETPEGPLNFAGANEAQIAVDNSGTVTDGDIYVTPGFPNVVDIFAESGEYLGQLTESATGPLFEACGVASGPDGSIYVGDYSLNNLDKYEPTSNPPANGNFSATFTEVENPCAVAAGTGPTSGALFSANYAGGLFKQDSTTGVIDYQVSGGPTTTVTVDSSSGGILAAVGNEVIEYDASGPSQAQKLSSFSAASPVQGIAVGPSGAVYLSREGAPGIEVLAKVPLPTVATEPPTDISPSGVTLNGSVNPEGEPLTDCEFEYGLTTSNGFEASVPCEPTASEIPPDAAVHNVSAAATGLLPNLTYRFRLTAANANGAEHSPVSTFSTFGPPQIIEIRASNADQSSATLEAVVDPRGFAASYRIEWGPTTSYGNIASTGEIEPGQEPAHARAEIAGLTAGTLYHYRVVATSQGGGTTTSLDHQVESLNACGLPEGRCLERVTPAEPGPIAESGAPTQLEPKIQAADVPGSLAYNIEGGLPGATRGGEVEYLGTRSTDGWGAAQFAPPILARNELLASAVPSTTEALSPSLSCAVVRSSQPLTPDPGTRLVIEAGGYNLYLRGSDGSYTAITRLPPDNADDVEGQPTTEYVVNGVSDDCHKVVFTSLFHYAGVGGVGVNRLYEWSEGRLQNVGFVPGPSGETEVEAVAGGETSFERSNSNAVSSNGARVFFSANRQFSPNSEEVNKLGVFVREDGDVTRDLSLSETSTPDEGATYQTATPDGSHVYFTANAGLTADSSPEGTDLYEYDLAKSPSEHPLTDLSADPQKDGAQVGGLLGVSEDGHHVYFAARGELVPGRGRTLSENQAAGSYSVYGAQAGSTSYEYVGTLTAADLRTATTSLNSTITTSRVSADGRYLLFQSSATITRHQDREVPQVYLFDSAASEEPIVCVSCRQDDKASLTLILHQGERPGRKAGAVSSA